MKKKSPEAELKREFRYASHHHLIPLYVLAGAAIVAILVLSCFVIVLWQVLQDNSHEPAAVNAVSALEQQYLPATVSPIEKKQYVYSANVRFPVSDPYNTFRYTYDPGQDNTKTSAVITLSTSQVLQKFESPLLQDPAHSSKYIWNMQECTRLYVIRFQPGVTQFGGFTPLKDVPLKDGRTAYIHKNTMCVPDSSAAMDVIETLDAEVSSIESF